MPEVWIHSFVGFIDFYLPSDTETLFADMGARNADEMPPMPARVNVFRPFIRDAVLLTAVNHCSRIASWKQGTPTWFALGAQATTGRYAIFY
jgi:hypothetical protein